MLTWSTIFMGAGRAAPSRTTPVENRLTIGFFLYTLASTRHGCRRHVRVPSKSSKSQPIPQLGDLEVAALEHVWNSGETSAKQLHAAVGVKRGISLNTVQSTLERLYRKHLLSRVKASHSYQYSARIEREELVAALIGDVLGRFRADSSSALSAFVEAAEDLDEDAIRALEAKLKTLQRRGRSK